MIDKAFNNKYYNCYVANIASVAQYYNREIFMIFSDSLFLNYHADKGLIADKISFFRSEFDEDECLRKFHRIFLKKNDFKNKDSLINHIKQTLKKGVNVLLNTDLYYCKWNALYLQSHIDHNILITGFEYSKFICFDPYFTQDLLYVSEESDIFCEWNCKDIHILDDKKIILSDCITVLKNNINAYVKDDNIQKSFQRFIDDVIKIDISSELGGNLNVYDIPLIRKLKLIQDNRLCYMELYKRIQNNFSLNSINVEDGLHELILCWNRLRMLMFKGFISNKLEYKMEDIIRLINTLSILEVQVAYNFLEIFEAC